MGDDVPVARQSVNSARRSVPRHRGELPSFAYDLAGGVCDVPPIEDVMRSRLLMTIAGNGHAAWREKEITVRGVSTSLTATDREMPALDRKRFTIARLAVIL